MKECDVIVVGAGISGLSAAKLLHEAGIDVVVLEARDRVGGRTWTVRKPEVGGYVDMGGSYVGPTQNNLLRMAKDLGLDTYKVDETQDLLYYSNGKARKFGVNELPAIGGFLDQLDLNNFIRTMDDMGKEVPAEAPWNAPKAWEWDRMTFQDFLNKTCQTKATKDFATALLNMILTAEPWEASLLWVLWYVKQCDGMKRILSTTNGGQERKFHGGSQQISEKIYERLGPQRVHLSQPVHQIIQREGFVYVKTLDGSEYKAKYVIQATPPAVQQKIHYEPELPALRNQLLQRLPVGAVMKCILYYKTAFWKDLGYCGSIMTAQDGQEFDMQFTLNDTKPDGSHPAIVGFIATDRLRRNYEALTTEQRKNKLAENLSKIFKSDDALKPIHYEEKCWSEEQYSGGCYATVWAPGLLTTHGHVLRRPVGNMYFAGTETAIWWACYMEGAVSSGERAAREILHVMGKIQKDEIWQKEKESKEVPETPFPVTWWETHAPSAKCVNTGFKVLGLTTIGLGAYLAFKRLGGDVKFPKNTLLLYIASTLLKPCIFSVSNFEKMSEIS